MRTVFHNIEDFYADNINRRYSGERDYGVDWHKGGDRKYRVSYVEKTGEVYAIALGYSITIFQVADSADQFTMKLSDDENVFLMAVVPTAPPPTVDQWNIPKDEEWDYLLAHENWSKPLDDLLEGWVNHYDIEWVQKQLTDYLVNKDSKND